MLGILFYWQIHSENISGCNICIYVYTPYIIFLIWMHQAWNVLIYHLFCMYFMIYLSNTISISDGVRVTYQLEKFMIPNGVIKINTSKKDIQYNSQTKKDKRTNNNLWNKTKDRAIRNPLTIGVELRCSGKVSSYKLGTTPGIGHKWGDDRIVITTNGKYPSSFMTKIFRNGLPGHGVNQATFEVMTWT